MAKFPAGCPDCGGPLARDGDEIKCLGCGRPILSNFDRKRFYEQHKDEILADIRKVGATVTRRKWQIPPGTFTSLKTRWLPLEYQKPPERREQPGNNPAPKLPDFSDTWPENVQIKWLDIWLYLVAREGKED